MDLGDLATAALATRPPGSDLLVVAAELGFRLLPCEAGAPETRTTADRLVFAADEGQAASVCRALARGLLLRAGEPVTPEAVLAVARALHKIP